MIVKIQRYKPRFWDFSNFQDSLGILIAPLILMLILWHEWQESGSLTELYRSLIIGFTASFILLVANLFYVFFNQEHNLHEVDSYIFNRHNNSLSVHAVSIWNSRDVFELCSLREIIDVNLEVFCEPNLKELKSNQSISDSRVSYQVKIKLSSGIGRTVEYNSISAFSDSKTQDEFRSLITQTDNVIKEILTFLEI